MPSHLAGVASTPRPSRRSPWLPPTPRTRQAAADFAFLGHRAFFLTGGHSDAHPHLAGVAPTTPRPARSPRASIQRRYPPPPVANTPLILNRWKDEEAERIRILQ